MKVLTSACGWRFNDVSSELFFGYLADVTHPYQQVRSILGSNLSACCQSMWIPGLPSAMAAVSANLTNYGGAYSEISPSVTDTNLLGDVPTALSGPAKDALDDLSSKILNWRSEAKEIVSQGPTNFSKAGKTGKHWRKRFLISS